MQKKIKLHIITAAILYFLKYANFIKFFSLVIILYSQPQKRKDLQLKWKLYVLEFV